LFGFHPDRYRGGDKQTDIHRERERKKKERKKERKEKIIRIT